MKKYICMIAYTLYSVDSRVRREAETLASLNEYNVSFLVPKKEDIPRCYSLDGVNITELNSRQYCGKSKLRYIISYGHFLLLAFIASTSLFLKRELDIIHIHNMPNFLVFAATIPRLFGKKVILDIHDSVPETYTAKFGKKYNFIFKLFCLEEALSCWFANKIICVNHIQRNTLIKRRIPEKKILVSMNVPDHKRFHLNPGKTEIGKSNKKFKMVYHGTIAKRLGIDLTIQAVAKLVDRITELEFYVIGGGDDAEEYKKMSKNMGLDKYVFFKEFVPVESLVPILKDMDLGVVSNRNNIATELMLPVKMLEYVAMNIPVVAPRLKTIQYYFTEEMVRYFEPENVDSLADAILELYKDESKRKILAQSAHKFIDKYGWKIYQMDLINLYKNLSKDVK